jgi:hypothetical protein
MYEPENRFSLHAKFPHAFFLDFSFSRTMEISFISFLVCGILLSSPDYDNMLQDVHELRILFYFILILLTYLKFRAVR